MHSLVLNKHTYQTSDVICSAESAIYITHIFANNFTTKKDSLQIFQKEVVLKKRKTLNSESARNDGCLWADNLVNQFA